MYAEKLYKNGKFYTMEQEGQAVEAVGVRDGKIVFTGTNEEAEKIESDEIIDIKAVSYTHLTLPTICSV